MSINLHIRMYSRMHEGSEGYGIALRVHSEHDWQEQSDAPIIVSRFPFRGDEYVCRLRRLPLWCLRHHLPPASGGTTKLSYAAPPSPRCEACHRILRSLPPPPSVSAPFEPFYRARSEAFYFPLAMSILCCWGWDSGAAGAAWPAAPSAMSGMRVSRAMLMLSASSEERASRHWPFTTFFA